jgi:drug/metabolite transporter (DMT)-like permease
VDVGSQPMLGIALALVSAAILSVGNLWQSRGVDIVTQQANGRSSFVQLIKTPIWVGGTALFGLAILLQMGSLAFAPLIVVQPIGVAALVFAALLTARTKHRWPSKATVRAIIISLIGVTAYVIVAALFSKQKPISDDQLIQMLIALAAVLVISAVGWIMGKGIRKTPIMYVFLGGVFSGFVAALGKTVILRVEAILKNGHPQFDAENILTLFCILGIGIASALSIYFVQWAHTCNSPDVVIAGLTVIDPAAAVILGIVILQEMAGAPVWTVFAFLIAGAVAVTGVVKLARAEGAEGGDETVAATPSNSSTG